MKAILAILLTCSAVALTVARLAGVTRLAWVWVLAPLWVPAVLTYVRQILFPRRRR